MRQSLKNCRRIVVKAGTSILTTGGKISDKNLSRLGRQIVRLAELKKEIALVSSGAIAFGMEAMDFAKRPKDMATLQACAAIGQGRMMHAYEQFFQKEKLATSQILLTRDNLEARERFLAARRTFERLFDLKTLPIVNENDTIATEEIAFGDNDILSVHVAHLIHADLLIILSDVDGFYLKDGSRVREVLSESEIDQTLVKHLKDSKTEKTVGGMRAKLKAARVAMRLGVPLMIASGHEEGVLEKAVKGEDVGSVFMAGKTAKTDRQKWIAFAAARKGTITVDQGAGAALEGRKKSLLPSGIVGVDGGFERGEVIEIRTADGKTVGRGVTRYSSRELVKIAGKKTHEIEAALGYKYQDEAVHRNDLVIWS